MKHTRRIRKRKQTRRKRKGGKKLGEGMYGVVVDPAIACVGKDTTGYVSKVLTPKESHYTGTAESLLKKIKANPVFAKLKEIDPEQKEFIYAEFCNTPGDLTEENKADGVTDDNKKFSYLMKRGGRSLADEFKEKSNRYKQTVTAIYNVGKDSIKKSTTLKESSAIINLLVDHLKPEIQSAVTYLKPIVKDVTKLCNKLYENGISQGDLHPGNVLRMDDGTLRIIDFDGAVVFDRKTHFEDFQTDDVGQFKDDAASFLVTKGEKAGDSDLGIIQIKVIQKIVDELSI